MDYDSLLQIALEKIMQSPLGVQIQTALDYYQKMQETIYNLVASDDEDSLMKLRIGTVLTLAVVNKLAEGKKIDKFTKQDWIDVANTVCDDAINIDEKDYSRLVFITYADYIDTSIKKVESFASAEQIDRIGALSSEIRIKAEQLDAGEIDEVDFIDDCLWISFEAMMKLLSVFSTKFIGGEYAYFIEAVVSLSISYGRLTLLNKENELLEQYLAYQNEIDEKLQAEYDAFMKEVEARARQFNELIEVAFTTDFRQRLKGSVDVALFVGVDEKDILKNTKEIDDFFMM